MAFRQPFARVAAADLAALETAIRVVVPNLSLIRGSDDPVVLPIGTLIVEKATAWTDPEIAAVQAIVTAGSTATPQQIAQRAVDTYPIELEALVLALVDQINVIRAALPVPLGVITPAQAVAAIRAKASTL